MAQVLKHPRALFDLAEIWSFIADDNEAAADRFLQAFEAKFALLATQPQMGRQRDELMPRLRSFPVGRYVVFYLPSVEGITLVRVLHSARDIGPDDFEPEGHA